MPHILWPEQPDRIREAWLRHHADLPLWLEGLLTEPHPPTMTAQVARAFLRCFYAARDLDRAERGLRAGGEHTNGFALAAIGRRVGELERRVAQLGEALQDAPTPGASKP